MSQYKSQIQNLFLSSVRKRHQPVEVVLNTGTSLHGKIKGYDQFSVTLTFRNKVEVIYKSAILFITALERKRRFPDSDDGGRRPIQSERAPRQRLPNLQYDDPPPPRKTPGRYSS